ncbi:uncharacterized protein LOC113549982 [Rhopalosiphum maidis]|uniref:uncharacterized protein LOC113549982 n=1 Tax=Rhopalosiphum maidis TaxID=43146 RepID=UPI000EFFA8A9|nr:uncharacterized protein LOC113549982 [Rhopalosiphum maidis]
MGRYQLYVAVMAIASLAAVQKASADEYADYSADEQYDEPKEMSESKIEHHQCEEYKSKIWNQAFSNPSAMQLMEVVFQTSKELGTNEVCSDTIRVISNFVNVMATNQNAHYSVGMLGKMLSFILREVDVTSNKFVETKGVFERIAKNDKIRDYIKNSTSRAIDLLKIPVIRSRLVRVVKAFESLIKPSRN